MHKIIYPIFFILLLLSACDRDEPTTINGETPVVRMESNFSVVVEEEVVYGEGLGHDHSSTSAFAVPLKLDIYYPENNDFNRPAFMFIHGGGFQGGTKTKPEIVAMANYFVSRGWVFASIDYRTTEEMGTISGMSPAEVVTFYSGIAPPTWINFALQNATSADEVKTSTAMYAAQRDAKAALRWLIANAGTYGINTDFITVGGASAGAVSAVALGISDPEDFTDEISLADDPTLATTNLNASYAVKSLVYFWGSNVKLELLEQVYGFNRYDSNDPELFLAHGTADANPTTTFSEAVELNALYDSTGVYSELVPLEGEGHGAWTARVNGKSLSELSFDFMVARQGLELE